MCTYIYIYIYIIDIIIYCIYRVPFPVTAEETAGFQPFYPRLVRGRDSPRTADGHAPTDELADLKRLRKENSWCYGMNMVNNHCFVITPMMMDNPMMMLLKENKNNCFTIIIQWFLPYFYHNHPMNMFKSSHHFSIIIPWFSESTMAGPFVKIIPFHGKIMVNYEWNLLDDCGMIVMMMKWWGKKGYPLVN